VDTFILVAAINRSTRSGITRALEILENARANVSGLLINMIESFDSEYQYVDYDHYYLKSTDAEYDPEVTAIEVSKKNK
jgi:Mrp family chromosome partitioning ATPase